VHLREDLVRRVLIVKVIENHEKREMCTASTNGWVGTKLSGVSKRELTAKGAIEDAGHG
jgi:hypothetical protein